MSDRSTNRTPFPRWLLISAIIILVAAVIIPRLDLYTIADSLRAIGYEPTSEMAAIEDSLQLTDTAKGIFNATRPALEDNTAFNEHCDSRDADVSVLGCYTLGNMYIYNVTTNDLSVVRESTTAHELLHAVWDRLDTSEKQSLASQLEEVYNNHTDQLSDEMESYDESERLDELHSRIGTEIADLPDSLEQHYAQYFQDQDAVVQFYDDYITPFDQLTAELEQLRADLDSLDATIEQQTSEYTTQNNELNQRITEFNICANTAGCFTNDEFNAERAELVAEQAELQVLYNQIDANIAAYNDKVQQYNNNVLRTQTLQDSINSNAQPANL